MQTEEAELSPYEIGALAENYRSAEQKLKDLKESVEKCKGTIAWISKRSSQAQRLLKLSKDIPGFSRERELAESVIAQCAQDLPKAEERLVNWTRAVKDQEAVLSRFDPALITRLLNKSADQAEIQELAKKLRPGVPVSPTGL